jgi:hypothetical protein
VSYSLNQKLEVIMKNNFITMLVGLTLLLLLFSNASPQSSSDYEIPTKVLSGGGGSRTSTNYASFDVIAEPLVSPCVSSSNYEGTEGFVYNIGAAPPPDTVPVWAPDTAAYHSDTIKVPISIGDISAYEIWSYEFLLTFDESILNAIGATSENTVSESWGDPLANVGVPGQVTVGGFGVLDPLPNGGILVFAIFEVVGNPGEVSPLHFESFTFNAGSPVARPIIDGSVTVASEEESITVTLPSGGEEWCIGSDTVITWSWVGSFTDVIIELSRDGNSTWDTLTPSTPNVGSWTWTVTGPASANCMVRISDAADGDPVDTSDATFTIVDESILVTFPNGGEVFDGGTDTNITWECSCVENVKIEYSKDAGSNWITEVGSTPAELGIYSWSIPDDSSNQCLIRICDAADNDPCDVSDALFTIRPPGDCVWVTLPDTTFGCSDTDSILKVPLYVSDVTGLEVYSVEMILTYDESRLTANCGCTTTDSTIAESWGPPTCNSASGSMSIAMAGVTTLSGSGVLLYACFTVDNLNPCDTTSVCFESFRFNEGDPTACTECGLIMCPCCQAIGGAITHCPSGLPVDNATVVLSGDASDSRITDAAGDYLFDCIPSGGDYIVKPEKDDDQGNAISAFDASIVLRCVVDLLDCGPCSLIAGDVSCNCGLSAFDASLILRYVVGLITEWPCEKDWVFVPTSYPLDTTNWCPHPESLVYMPLTSSHYNEDYIGMVLGDVSGNWSGKEPGTEGSPPPFASDPLEEFEGQITAQSGTEMVLPVQVKGLTDVFSIELTFKYDPSLLDFVQARRSDLTRDLMLESSASEGNIRVALAGSNPINGSGTIVELVFNAGENSGGARTEVTLTESRFNEHIPQDVTRSARIAVTGSAPKELSLTQNFPNPFNPETIIEFSVPRSTQVRVEILNMLGQRVATLVDGHRDSGNHQVRWDGKDSQGNSVANGVYFYRLATDEGTIVRKMLLMK